ncbi:MAG: hypothetical protein AAF735_07905 [Myxococcota bacterium]
MLQLVFAIGTLPILAAADKDPARPVYTVPFALFRARADLAIPHEKGWSRGCTLPLKERLGVPPGVAAFEHRGWKVAPGLVRDVVAATKALPRRVARLFEKHVCAVVFVSGLGSTAQIRMIGEDPPRKHGILLIGDRIDSTANAWFTEKERSPFRSAPGFEIHATMADAANDTRQRLIEYVFTHELAHVLEYRRPAPRIPLEFADLDRALPAEFADERGWYFPTMTGTQPLDVELAYTLYSVTVSKGLPSPYAFVSEHEDFAESFALYVYSVLLDRPWKIELRRDQTTFLVLDDRWSTKRCATRRKMIERFLREESAN